MFNKPRLLTPGPTPVPEAVRLALARDMIHHRKSGFKTLMNHVQEKLQVLFGTNQPVLPLSSSGTGAMTAAVYSLFAPGEKVAVIVGGKFGQRWHEIALSRNLECALLPVEWGRAVEPAAVADLLKREHNLKGLLIQQSETSTGVLMPIREIAALTRDSGVLLVVDGISGVGISPAPMDAWGIDCLLTGSQKGLMLPPGLALIALSARAWEKAESVPTACYYFNLLAERKNVARGQTNFTSPVNLVVGLDAALDLLLQNGLDAVYRKQWALTQLTRAGVDALGLELFVKKDFAWGITSLLMPQGMDAQKILASIEEKFGVVMAGGQDELKGKIARIGHMGWVDWADCVAGLCALQYALGMNGADWIMERHFLTAAMSAYEKALQEWRWHMD